MIDISQTVAPKSDQLNADDLIGGPRTIRVTRVSQMKEPDQPIAVYFEGDGGKPYKPGKSMRRLLLRVWGSDGAAYVGRRMTLYRDEAVQFGGLAVGGIRISHVSDIPRDITMALTVTRASRKPYTVKPLPAERGPAPGRGTTERSGEPDAPKPAGKRERLYDAARAEAAKGTAALTAFREGLDPRADQALGDILPELERIAADADAADDGGCPGFDPADSEAA